MINETLYILFLTIAAMSVLLFLGFILGAIVWLEDLNGIVEKYEPKK